MTAAFTVLTGHFKRWSARQNRRMLNPLNTMATSPIGALRAGPTGIGQSQYRQQIREHQVGQQAPGARHHHRLAEPAFGSIGSLDFGRRSVGGHCPQVSHPLPIPVSPNGGFRCRPPHPMTRTVGHTARPHYDAR